MNILRIPFYLLEVGWRESASEYNKIGLCSNMQIVVKIIDSL